jgi:hypothetical protein
VTPIDVKQVNYGNKAANDWWILPLNGQNKSVKLKQSFRERKFSTNLTRVQDKLLIFLCKFEILLQGFILCINVMLFAQYTLKKNYFFVCGDFFDFCHCVLLILILKVHNRTCNGATAINLTTNNLWFFCYI